MDPSDLARPTPAQVRWQDFELGVIFHYDLPLFAPGGWGPETRHQTWDPNLFQPPQLDTDQWLEAAAALGASYAIFTATHHGGFLQWQSDAYDYGLRQSSWADGKGDIVRDFVDSCRQRDIAPGIYLSTMFNAHWGARHGRVGDDKDSPEQRRYNQVCEQMVTELCSRYGPLCELWFDAGVLSPQEGGPDVLPIVDKYQPDCVFYHSRQRRDHRWIGNEDGVAGYPCWGRMTDLETSHIAHHKHHNLLHHGDANGDLWCPAMCDVPLREHHWFWQPETEKDIETLSSLTEMYYNSVGCNCNLVLGVTPDTRGLVPEPDVRRLGELGRFVSESFSHPLARTEATGQTILLELPESTRLDHVAIMEDITEGERIRAYRVEGQIGRHTWHQLVCGRAVGHKRIEMFRAREVHGIRLKVTNSSATPRIRSLEAFSVET